MLLLHMYIYSIAIIMCGGTHMLIEINKLYMQNTYVLAS